MLNLAKSTRRSYVIVFLRQFLVSLNLLKDLSAEATKSSHLRYNAAVPRNHEGFMPRLHGFAIFSIKDPTYR